MMTSSLGCVWKNVTSKSREILPSTGETTSGDVCNMALVRSHLEVSEIQHCETTSGDASPALGFPVHDGHGVSLAKSHEIDQIIGLSNVGGEAERIKIAWLHDKAQRDLSDVCKHLMGGSKDRASLDVTVNAQKTRRN